ncbi:MULTISPECIES: glycosyltransferase family 77 protein [Pseudomonas]|uniref:glycosyltransferase family 77 protein n=1 Tax=Pseudomonas TaxID=286 RepID=UPI001E424667|nr:MULTISPECIES: glycosyltransferase family 77 protein [Pseudomonas]MCE1115654.1 glycosyltransferase family 77 protein [Pseudomonas sp. NMI795_08]
MSMPPHSPDWAHQSAFTANLYLLQGGAKVPVTHIKKRYGPSLSGGFEQSTGDNGWLMAQGNGKAMALHFRYHSGTPNRLHFMLALDTDRARQLGKSRNDYLGLYEHATVTDYWKLEPLAWTDTTVRCRIRDHLGNAVGVEAGPPYYLKVGEGSPREFVISRIG